VRRRRRLALRTNYRSHAFALNVQHGVPAGKEGCAANLLADTINEVSSACLPPAKTLCTAAGLLCEHVAINFYGWN
jgi:hypothetical protein